MTSPVQLEADVSVAPQLAAADFAGIAALGFRSVVNNRPDGEAPDQLPNAEAEAAARHHGLEFRHLPVENLRVTDDAVVDAFARTLDELPRPILFYCRTGTRSTILWAQAAVRRLGVTRTLEIASQAGIDLDVISDNLVERAADAGSSRRQPSRRPVADNASQPQFLCA